MTNESHQMSFSIVYDKMIAIEQATKGEKGIKCQKI